MKTLHIPLTITLIASILFGANSMAQTSVGINTTTPNSNAVLHLVSPNNNQGLLVPQLSTAERTASTFTSALSQNSDNNGLLVFDKDLNTFFYWETTAWKSLLADNLAEVLKAGNDANKLNIKGLANPIDPQDAVTKLYVDDTLQRVLVHIEEIENIVNDNSTHITDITNNITEIKEKQIEYWDSIVRHSENFTTLFDSIYQYNEHFNEYWDSIVHHSERITTLFDSVYIYRDYFTEIHDSVFNFSSYLNEYWDSIVSIRNNQITLFDSITRIQKIFEQAEFNLPNGQMYIGGSDDKAIAVDVSGDVLISTKGITDIQQNTIGERELDKTNILLNGFATPQSDVSFGDATNQYRITNLALPIDAKDATTKAYVDDTVQTVIKILATNTANDHADTERLQYLINTGKFALPGGFILIGNSDSAHAVPISGDILIDSTTGIVNITPGAIGPIDIAGIADSGAVGQVLVSKGDGTFEWQGKFAGGMSDDLSDGYFWIGNASNKAEASAKNTIPLSGFGLPDGYIVIGSSNSANAVALSGDIAIDKTTGISAIQNASIIAENLTTTGNTSLSNGNSGDMLTSNGNGYFSWTSVADNNATNEIQDLTISGTDLKITNNASATNIALGNIRLDQFAKPTGTIDMNSQTVTGITAPTVDSDAANKKYIDDIATSINDKINATNLTSDAVPVWNGSKLADSKIWSDGANIAIGGGKPATYSYNCEINGSFKTQKIYHSSDQRWKKDIETLDSALAKVVLLHGVKYNWRTEEFPEQNFPAGSQIGLIAQEVEKIVPEVVNTDANGYKAVEYANLIAYLIEAMKEQQNIIEDQRTQIIQLQKQNSNFDSRLEKLENALRQAEK